MMMDERGLMKSNFQSPLRLTAALVVLTAIVAESIGMLIVHQTRTPHSVLVYLDSFLMVVFLLPAIYLLVYRPMATFISEIVELNSRNERDLGELQTAMQEIKVLKGILPICMRCKKIRDDQGYWKQLEQYISDHSDARFSHGICQECASTLYPEYFSDSPKG